MSIQIILFFLLLVFPFTEKHKKDIVPGTVIAHVDSDANNYIGSPSIVKLPDGAYLASHDIFGRGDNPLKNHTQIYKSNNKGKSWNKIAQVKDQFWSNLFYHKNTLYLFGTTKQYGSCIIRKSVDGGYSWTAPSDSKNGLLLSDGEYHTAPMPMLIYDGKIWRAMEDRNPPEKWGVNFRSFIISADIDSDLLRADSWTSTNRVRYDQSWPGNAWLEGNVVKHPEGHLVCILRNNYRPEGGRACMIHLSDDGTKLSFDPDRDFIDFPGGCKKFTIRYDEVSGKYWSLSNYIPDKFKGGNPERTRNTLALISSEDLKNWIVNRIILQHPDIAKVGFQYADWSIEGNDIIAVSRTAFRDDIGDADNCHNANYLTFHRIKKFRRNP